MDLGEQIGAHPIFMQRPLPIYLHVLRKRWGLSQRELAFLLGISPAMLSKLERLERKPSKAVIIGAEVIFGASPRDAFPSSYERIEAKVMRQAAALYERLEDRQDQLSKEKCRRLLGMIKRVRAIETNV
jgi:transcriptional regulator with XRE-family HTH domain